MVLGSEEVINQLQYSSSLIQKRSPAQCGSSLNGICVDRTGRVFITALKRDGALGEPRGHVTLVLRFNFDNLTPELFRDWIQSFYTRHPLSKVPKPFANEGPSDKASNVSSRALAVEFGMNQKGHVDLATVVPLAARHANLP